MEPIGRKDELEELNGIYESPRFEFGYVYGQRRIGETTPYGDALPREKDALPLRTG